MKTTEVTISLSMEIEFALMNKYGRRCSREGLVMRAIADAVKGPAKEPAVKKTRKARTPANGLDDSKQPEQTL